MILWLSDHKTLILYLVCMKKFNTNKIGSIISLIISQFRKWFNDFIIKVVVIC